MPRVSIQQTNFTAGELTPRLHGRTDMDRYANGAKKLRNAIVTVHGGAKRRAGTAYLHAAKFNATKSRLIPFIVDRDVAYMLEFAESFVRVYGTDGALVQELASPYTAAMLPDVDFCQGADVMFLTHPTVAIYLLRRIAVGQFDLAAAPFDAAPVDEQGHYLAATLTLSAAGVGTGITATASASVFLKSDVGRRLICAAGIATVTAYTSATVLVVQITQAFAGTSLASAAWHLDASPQAMIRPAGDTVGGVVHLDGAMPRQATLTMSSVTVVGLTLVTVVASAAVFVAGDVGKNLYGPGGSVFAISGFTDSTHLSGTIIEDFPSKNVPSGTWGIAEETWRTEDVGKYVAVNGGYALITEYLTPQTVNAKVLTTLSGTTLAPEEAWTLQSAVWTATNGYPRTCTLHEQRLMCAGSAAYPQTLWGSRTGEYLNFTRGTQDSDSYSFTIAADEVNPVSYLAALRAMVIHTYGGEFSLQGGIEKPITPTNVRIRPESPYGMRGVRPLAVGKESVFVQRAGRKVRAVTYSADIDGYVAPEISVMAEHITLGGIAQLAYQQEPYLLIWAVRNDGVLLSCTFDREQSVSAWASHDTDGIFESIACIPSGDTDQLWAVVQRTVNGSTVRYIERFVESFQPIYGSTVDYGLTVDCATGFSNPAGQTVFNVPQLIGKTVDILADGQVQPQQVVDGSGNLTLARSAKLVLIGLPFTTEITPLTPEVGSNVGTAQGNSMRTSEITLRFLDTLGATVRDVEGREQPLPFRKTGTDVLDQAPPLFTGLVRVEMLDWARGSSEITIVQDQPLPLHLLSIIRKFTVNDG